MKTRDVALGSIYAMSSRMVLMATGFVLQIVLARSLGPEMFGLYALIISILLWAEYSVTMGIPSVFQKIISETHERLRVLVGAVVRYSVPYCLTVGLIFAASSPLVATLLEDPRLGMLLVVASLDIPVFGLYTTFICMLNGHGRFLLQSTLAATYSLVRTVVIISAVLAGFGIVGALVGNAIGSTVGLALASWFTWRLARSYRRPTDEETTVAYREVNPRLLAFGIPFALEHLFNSVLIHMDIWFVKALSGDGGPSAAELGFYAVAYNLARVPYFIISGVSFTSFPAVSKAFFENRVADARDLVRQALRLTFIVLLPLNALVLSTAEEMITFLFSATYAPAADAFRILFAGISLYTVFMFQISTIAAENRPVTAMLLSVSLIPVAVGLNLLLIPRYGIEGAALATTSICALGIVVAWPFVRRKLGGFIDYASLARVGLAAAAVYLLSTLDVLYHVHLVVGYCLLGVAYFAVLFLVREVDMAMLHSAFPRLRPRPGTDA